MDGDPLFERSATALGLPPNRLISWSKSGYRRSHVTVFNTTIAGNDHSRLWRGDLDLGLGRPGSRRLDYRLRALCERVGIRPIVKPSDQNQPRRRSHWLIGCGRAGLIRDTTEGMTHGTSTRRWSACSRLGVDHAICSAIEASRRNLVGCSRTARLVGVARRRRQRLLGPSRR